MSDFMTGLMIVTFTTTFALLAYAISNGMVQA